MEIKYKLKLINLKKKNQKLIITKNVAKVLNGNEVQLLDKFSLAMITDLQHAPMTSVDAECSFSTYKNI